MTILKTPGIPAQKQFADDVRAGLSRSGSTRSEGSERQSKKNPAEAAILTELADHDLHLTFGYPTRSP